MSLGVSLWPLVECPRPDSPQISAQRHDGFLAGRSAVSRAVQVMGSPADPGAALIMLPVAEPSLFQSSRATWRMILRALLGTLPALDEHVVQRRGIAMRTAARASGSPC